MPEVVRYGVDAALTALWTRRLVGHADLYCGVDALNAVIGIFLRAIRVVNKVVFYAIDWSPKRFESVGLDVVYHVTDRTAALLADETWNTAEAMNKGRWPGWLPSLIREGVVARSKTVQTGIASSLLAELPKADRNRHRLVFMGHLLEKQGLQHVIAALPLIAQNVTDVELAVVGSGPFEEQLRRLVGKYGVTDRVSFLGYVPDESEVLQILASSSIGLAPYLESVDNYTAYADPGKVKNYLAAGLPVVISRVPVIARQIESHGCGCVVPAEPQSLAAAVTTLLLEDDESLVRRRERAIEFVRGLGWDSIFADALGPEFGHTPESTPNDRPPGLVARFSVHGSSSRERAHQL
ncbi:MAG TPA: glycosyltransferase [Acidimicrobiales bacterium]|nr:glycosyltransferase [Acidimicrobiales bacterium]